MEPLLNEQVINRARAGDEGACRQLVDHLYPTVIAIVRRNLPRRDEEEDLSQEIFMKVFARISDFRGEQPIAHWVSRIATNTCYDRLRRQRVRPVRNFADLGLNESEFLTWALTGDNEPPPASQSESASELIEKLFTNLNAREQLVLRLLDLEENSVEETCNLTGWGASKVKVTAMRARRKLRAALERLEGQTPLKSEI